MALTRVNTAPSDGAIDDDWQGMLRALSLEPERTALPQLAEPLPSANLWKILKEAFGSSKIVSMTLPLVFHEPITELMKRAEDLTHASILNEAASLPKGSIERHVKVAVFALSFCQGNVRTQKPLSPTLGETYELIDKRQGFRLLVEEVYQNLQKDSFIDAMHAEGRGWVLEAVGEPRVKFAVTGGLPCIDIQGPSWVDCLTFADGETFTWTKMTVRVNGIMIGTQAITCHGQITIQAQGEPKRRVSIKFLEPSLLTSKVKKGQVEGVVEEEVKDQYLPLAGWKLQGNYHQAIDVTRPDKSTTRLWTAPSEPAESRYGMSRYVLQLNQYTDEMRMVLPPTDSRRRKDLRLLETGPIKQAEQENMRIDTLSRQKLARIGVGPCPAPRWFTATDDPIVRYRYKGGYWAARESGDWGDIPNIFAGPEY
ncbi:hypothetical protein WJX73_003344 [Symbiochloris irregularis]|uniref:Oxysterol-binding protein n=1 Tax=Symbiochloris irregularis TaxID=706552 RepID=A0AAW1P6A9_9CHLO